MINLFKLLLYEVCEGRSSFSDHWVSSLSAEFSCLDCSCVFAGNKQTSWLPRVTVSGLPPENELAEAVSSACLENVGSSKWHLLLIDIPILVIFYVLIEFCVHTALLKGKFNICVLHRNSQGIIFFYKTSWNLKPQFLAHFGLWRKKERNLLPLWCIFSQTHWTNNNIIIPIHLLKVITFLTTENRIFPTKSVSGWMYFWGEIAFFSVYNLHQEGYILRPDFHEPCTKGVGITT